MKIANFFGKSVIAGMLIACAAAVYINVGGPLGASLFAAGLITIIYLGMKLFTGKVGYSYKYSYPFFIPMLLLVLLGNIAGSFIICALKVAPNTIWEDKLTIDPIIFLLRAIVCGLLIHAAVWAFANKKTILVAFLVVPLFILSGAEHSIADTAYMINSGIVSWKSLGYLSLAIVGNGIGAIALQTVLEGPQTTEI